MLTQALFSPLRMIASDDEDDDLLISDDVTDQPEEVDFPEDPGSEFDSDSYPSPEEEENPEEF